MNDLIQRIEAAKEPRRELFIEAWFALHGAPETEELHRPFDRYRLMLDAQAWTSAAEMLLQPGAEYELRVNGFYSHERPACHAWLEDGSEGRAAHPSLALLAAILRAERKDDE